MPNGLGKEVHPSVATTMAEEIAAALESYLQAEELKLRAEALKISAAEKKTLAAVIKASESILKALNEPIVKEMVVLASTASNAQFSAYDLSKLLNVLPSTIYTRLAAVPPKPPGDGSPAQVLCGALAAIAVKRLGVSAALSAEGPEAPTVVFTYRACEAFDAPLKLTRSTTIQYIKLER